MSDGLGKRGHLRESPEVDGAVADALPDASDDFVDPDVVNVVCRDDLEADVLVVRDIRTALVECRLLSRSSHRRAEGGTHRHLAADSSMDAIVGHQALLPRDVEEAAVRDAGLVGGRPRDGEVPPRVEVRVEVDDRDGAVDLVQGAQDGQHDGVVASEAATPGLSVCRRWNVGSGWETGLT